MRNRLLSNNMNSDTNFCRQVCGKPGSKINVKECKNPNCQAEDHHSSIEQDDISQMQKKAVSVLLKTLTNIFVLAGCLFSRPVSKNIKKEVIVACSCKFVKNISTIFCLG